MTNEIWIVTCILLATIIAFVSLLTLLLTGILTPTEATAGFSNSLVLMIAGLFVVGGAILESGVADLAGRWLGRVGGTSTGRLTATVMLASALLSAFLSSTGTVAVMLPVVLSLCRRAEVSPSKLLIPLAFGASLGGMLTLIGTPPNMVVNQELRDAGLETFNFFSFAPAGLLMLGLGIVFMCAIGTRLLPAQRVGAADTAQNQGFVSRPELIHNYGVDGQICEIRIPRESTFAGRTLRDLRLRTTFHVNVLAVSTPHSPGSGARGSRVRKCEPDTFLQPGVTLFIKASSEQAVTNLIREGQLELVASPAELPEEVHLAELIIPPRSEFIGRTIRDVDFFRIYGAMVLALQNGNQPVNTRTSDTPLGPGDALLIAANQSALKRLRKSRHNILLVSEQEEQRDTSLTPAARWVVVILIGMLIAPLALELAEQLGVSPYPLLMGVALAASTAFSTPVASPINALVAGAGNYRFGDFLKVGVPLQLLILLATLAIVPFLFPFPP